MPALLLSMEISVYWWSDVFYGMGFKWRWSSRKKGTNSKNYDKWSKQDHQGVPVPKYIISVSFFFIPHLFPSRLCIVKHGTSNQGGCVGRCNEIYKQSNCRMCLYLGRGPSMNTLQNTWPRFSLDLQKIVFFFRSVTTLTPCIHL